MVALLPLGCLLIYRYDRLGLGLGSGSWGGMTIVWLSGHYRCNDAEHEHGDVDLHGGKIVTLRGRSLASTFFVVDTGCLHPII